jgi:hypothetical protein
LAQIHVEEKKEILRSLGKQTGIFGDWDTCKTSIQ